MLDKLFVNSIPETEILYRTDYDPTNVVLSDEVVNPHGENLVALFPPWHGGGKAYEVLIRRLTKRNYAVLTLKFDDQQLTHDSDQVLDSFLSIANRSAERLNNLADAQRYGTVALVAASLGTPALAMTASQFSRFDSATLITPGANLADCMWHGMRTQRIRRELEANGETLETIDPKWQPIAPINHIEALRGKKVTIKQSTTDTVIPARSQRQYVDALIEAGVNPTVHTTTLGHYASIGTFCSSGKLSQ